MDLPTINNNVTYLKKRRKNTIQILYRYFILECKTNIKQEAIDGFQLLNEYDEQFENYIFKISDEIDNLINICESNLDETWKWKRIPNIIKAILVNAVYEITNNITPKAIVINESIELTRSYLPSWETSFINAILDKI
ncbi:transcription antitermination factor NusB [Spiroplasma turonicum]|nr:transcription antitermination factor NusB [Spiroplasma turonicum]ALX70750.1 transcription antitermination protein NusB [Spiroplasma turonicum]